MKRAVSDEGPAHEFVVMHEASPMQKLKLSCAGLVWYCYGIAFAALVWQCYGTALALPWSCKNMAAKTNDIANILPW